MTGSQRRNSRRPLWLGDVQPTSGQGPNVWIQTPGNRPARASPRRRSPGRAPPPSLRTDPGRAVRPLDGSPAPDGEHPAALAGSAAAAAAVGDTASRDDLLDRAGKLDEEHATYYGSAVHVLARVMLTTRRLGGC